MAGRKEAAIDKAWASRQGKDFVIHQGRDLKNLMDPVRKTSHLVGLSMNPPCSATQIPVISLWNIAEMGPHASLNVENCCCAVSERLKTSPSFVMGCLISNSQPTFANCYNSNERLVELDTNAHWNQWMQAVQDPRHRMHAQE